MQRTARLTFKRLTGPSAEPVTLAEAKAFARVDISDDDALVAKLITAAREHCEAITHRQFITATYALLMDGFPAPWRADSYRVTARREGSDIILPRPALQSVQSITYTDVNQVAQTVDASVYKIATFDEPARIALRYQQVWPIALDEIDSVRIDYTAGYGDTAATVPEGIKQAMSLLISHWYENREGTQPVTTLSREMDFSIKETLRPFTCAELWQGSSQ